MTTTDDRRAAKAWRLRNSNGRHSWGDEYGRHREVQAPPTETENDATLPPGTRQLADPDDATLGRAIVHAHGWSVSDPDA